MEKHFKNIIESGDLFLNMREVLVIKNIIRKKMGRSIKIKIVIEN